MKREPDSWLETLAKKARLEAPPAADVESRVLATLRGALEPAPNRVMEWFAAASCAAALASAGFAVYVYAAVADPLNALFWLRPFAGV